MGVFEITAPDGKVYEIEGANAQGALAALQQHLSSPPTQPQAPPQPEASDPLGNATGAPSPVVRASAMPYGEQMANVGTTVDKGVRMAANGMTFGLADKFAGGMDALTGKAPSYDEGVKAQRATTEQIRKETPGPAAAAEMAGGLASGTGLIKAGVTLGGRATSMLGRVLGFGTEGAAYGAAHGAGNTYSDKLSDYLEHTKTGAATGALIGGALPVVGPALGAVYRTGAAFLGPRVEGLSRGASTLLRGSAQADEAGIRNLTTMGPDAMLVDAGPSMLGLGQGAGTGTGEGRTRLVNALMERDRGTGQRLEQTLNRELGPAPVPSQVERGLAESRSALAPQYEQVLQNAQPVNTRALAGQLDAIATAERGPAQRAARQVREMLNDPRAGQADQFANLTRDLDNSPATLLNTRQAVDGLIADATDPNTIRVLSQARAAIDAELTTAVPGIKNVDAQFAELSRQSQGLQRGSQVFDTGKTAIRPGELRTELAEGALPQGTQIGPSAAPARIREGARAEIDRIVGTNVNDLNALERKLGTPQDWNSQKAAEIFGEGPHARVAKALMDNRQFRDTYQKIVQNSQTAQRTSASGAMEGAAGGNVPHDTTATGLALKAVSAVAKAISGASGAATKDEIGRLLSTQGPEVQRIARELLNSAQTTGQNARAISRVASSPYWIGASTPETSGRTKKQ